MFDVHSLSLDWDRESDAILEKVSVLSRGLRSQLLDYVSLDHLYEIVCLLEDNFKQDAIELLKYCIVGARESDEEIDIDFLENHLRRLGVSKYEHQEYARKYENILDHWVDCTPFKAKLSLGNTTPLKPSHLFISPSPFKSPFNKPTQKPSPLPELDPIIAPIHILSQHTMNHPGLDVDGPKNRLNDTGKSVKLSRSWSNFDPLVQSCTLPLRARLGHRAQSGTAPQLSIQDSQAFTPVQSRKRKGEMMHSNKAKCHSVIGDMDDMDELLL